MNLGEELLGAGQNTGSLGPDGTENYIVSCFLHCKQLDSP